ncbi:MAG: hypothetical protein ACIAQ0_08095 [Phycisphaerales bacterium JB058]
MSAIIASLSVIELFTQPEAIRYGGIPFGESQIGENLTITLNGRTETRGVSIVGRSRTHGLFVQAVYWLDEPGQPYFWEHGWKPETLPANSFVQFYYDPDPEHRAIAQQIAGFHPHDISCFVGAVSIRRELLWFTACLGTIGMFWFGWRAFRTHRRLRRFKRDLCPHCKYPLLSGELVTCPECGLRVLNEEAPRQSLAAGL